MDKDNFIEQITYDLRTDLQKAMTREFKSTATFKAKLDIFEDKARIITSEEVKDGSVDTDNSVIYELQNQRQFLHIVSTNNPGRVNFVFYSSLRPFVKKIGEFTFSTSSCKQGTRAMLVNDLRRNDSRDSDSVTVVVDDFRTKKVVRFTWDPTYGEWNEPKVKLACIDDDRLLNCFALDDNSLLLVMKKATVRLDCREKGEKLKPQEVQSRRAQQFKQKNFGQKAEVKQTDFREMTFRKHAQIIGEDYDSHGSSVYCTVSHEMVPNLNSDQKVFEFLMVFDHAESIPPQLRSSQIFKGTNSPCNSWIGRFMYSEEHKSLSPCMANQHSLYLKRTTVCSTFEYAKDRMIVSVEPNVILLFNNWKCVRQYTDQTQANTFIQQGYISKLPGFDEASFPFLAIAGSQAILIINPHDEILDQLVLTPSSCRYSQQAFFFKVQDYGQSVHFTTVVKHDDGTLQLDWVQMRFKPDFKDTLQRIGGLPICHID